MELHQFVDDFNEYVSGKVMESGTRFKGAIATEDGKLGVCLSAGCKNPGSVGSIYAQKFVDPTAVGAIEQGPDEINYFEATMSDLLVTLGTLVG